MDWMSGSSRCWACPLALALFWMAALCIALAAARIFQGEHAYDYAAILFAYLAGAQAHQCWKTRRRSAFVASAVYTFALAANLILFLG